MKVEDYNPKAREAFGKSLVDMGSAIFKGFFLVFTILPVSLIMKGTFDGTGEHFSFSSLAESVGVAGFVALITFMSLSIFLAQKLRDTGLLHIHESEGKQT